MIISVELEDLQHVCRYHRINIQDSGLEYICTKYAHHPECNIDNCKFVVNPKKNKETV